MQVLVNEYLPGQGIFVRSFLDSDPGAYLLILPIELTFSPMKMALPTFRQSPH